MTIPRVRLMLLVVLLLLAAPVVAFAKEPPKWGYVQAGYIDFDPDGGISEDGWFAGASFSLFKHFHALAEYDDLGDTTLWNAGFGWHGLLGEPADLFAEAVWNDVEVDSSSGDFSDDGYEVAAGLRWKFTDWLEANGKVSWVDFSEGGDDTLLEVGGIVSIFNDRLGFGASWETGDADTLRGFARFNFGR